MKHRWVKLSKFSDFSPKMRKIRRFKNSKKHSVFWRRKGWKFFQANRIYPAGWRKTFGKETCIAMSYEHSHTLITYSFFWMPKYRAIYPPKPVITEHEKQRSETLLAKRVNEYWGEKLLHLTRQQASCINKALYGSLKYHDYKVDEITDDELNGVWELMEEIWGEGSFLSMMAAALEDNEAQGGYNAD